MDNGQTDSLDPMLKEARAKLLARVYAFILSPDWGEPDEPVIIGTRQRRPSRRKKQNRE
ncbi:MAG: hypothetical protein KC434_04115 [Anaerolineales bacterium]|jgi:hypothetical protein|nr:hypothetical protein [Anaerolineales bacterium]